MTNYSGYDLTGARNLAIVPENVLPLRFKQTLQQQAAAAAQSTVAMSKANGDRYCYGVQREGKKERVWWSS